MTTAGPRHRSGMPYLLAHTAPLVLTTTTLALTYLPTRGTTGVGAAVRRARWRRRSDAQGRHAQPRPDDAPAACVGTLAQLGLGLSKFSGLCYIFKAVTMACESARGLQSANSEFVRSTALVRDTLYSAGLDSLLSLHALITLAFTRLPTRPL